MHGKRKSTSSLFSWHLARGTAARVFSRQTEYLRRKKKKLTLIYCSLIARCSATKLYKIANGYFFFFNLSFLVFVLSIVHLQFFSDSKFPPGSFV